jgi:hypothetical protein
VVGEVAGVLCAEWVGGRGADGEAQNHDWIIHLKEQYSCFLLSPEWFAKIFNRWD